MHMTKTKKLNILFTTTLFMYMLDVTMVVATFATLAEAFHVDPVKIVLMIAIYLIAIGIFINFFFWASHRMGLKKGYLFGLSLFIIGSMICGLGEVLSTLLLGRGIQALGAASCIASGIQIALQEINKKNYAKTAANVMFFTITGAVLGPLVGGLLIMTGSWSVVFLTTVPLSIGLFIVAVVVLPEYKPKKKIHFDWLGFVLFAVVVTSLAFFLESLGSDPMIWGIACLIVLMGIPFYLYHSKYTHKPMLDLTLFELPNFSRYFIISNVMRLVVAGIFISTVIFLQVGMKLMPIQTGLMMSVFALGSVFARVLISKGYVVFDQYWHLVLSGFLLALTILSMAHMTFITPLYMIALILFFQGCLVAIFLKHINQTIFSHVQNSQLFEAIKCFTVFQFVSWGLASLIIGEAFQLLQQGVVSPFLIPPICFQQIYYILSGLLFVLCLFINNIYDKNSKRAT